VAYGRGGLARNVSATLEDRRQMLDKLLEPLPENFEANAPRLLDC
jgi:hypothetical protein